ncbi:MAG: hypothetical protein QOE33_2121 [Acidobacteriota bacterium]|nr:hypothetical protein [Acidobacteriota bacterium]
MRSFIDDLHLCLLNYRPIWISNRAANGAAMSLRMDHRLEQQDEQGGESESCGFQVGTS